jgi:hypothetical protein
MVMVELKTRSIAFLLNPITIFAFLILFINDHIIKYQFPSWVSGKISDIAWLYIFPGVLIFIISAFTGKYPNITSRKIWIVAILFTIIGFVGVKTIYPFHNVIVNIFRLVLNMTPQIVMDKTDLFTLPILILSILVWKNNKPILSKNSKFKALIVSLIFLILTIASQPAVNYGISCLYPTKSGILAISNANYMEPQSFITTDGGLTWTIKAKKVNIPTTCPQSKWYGDRNEIDYYENNIYYHSLNNMTIEARSEDNNWKTIYDFRYTPPMEALDLLSNSFGSNSNALSDIYYDGQSGNTIFAMGTNGILIQTKDDQWKWVKVGSFFRPNPFTLKAVIQLFGLYFLNLILFAFLVFRYWTAKGVIDDRDLYTLQFFIWIVMNIIVFPTNIFLHFNIFSSILAIILILYIIGICRRPIKFCLELHVLNKKVLSDLLIKLLVVVSIWILLCFFWLFSIIQSAVIILVIGTIISGILTFYWDRKNPEFSSFLMG